MAKYDYSEYSGSKDHFINATDPSRVDEDMPGYRYAPTARIEIAKPRFTPSTNAGAKPGEQLKLFQYGRPVISGLYSDPSMRSAVPTLLGAALNKYPDALPDISLSQHSSRIVKKGIALGAIKGDLEGRTGKATFKGLDKNLSDTIRVTGDEDLPEGHTRMSESDLAAARTTVRDILRPKKLSTQFDAVHGPAEPHPQLPGMD